MNVDPLGDLLVREKLLTQEQLQTAIGLQRELGGDLRSMIVKLGYVKDADLVDLVAREEHVSASAGEITEDVIDFSYVERLPRELLERYQVVPLKSEGSSLVLAMADPNDLAAIEEIQFRAGVRIEPAVASRNAIRRALEHLDELAERFEAKQAAAELEPEPAFTAELAPVAEEHGELQDALRRLPIEKLLRAYILLQVERGHLSAADLLDRAKDL